MGSGSVKIRITQEQALVLMDALQDAFIYRAMEDKGNESEKLKKQRDGYLGLYALTQWALEESYR